MNGILSIEFESTIEHSMCEHNCAATCTKTRRNEKHLGVHIIKR